MGVYALRVLDPLASLVFDSSLGIHWRSLARNVCAVITSRSRIAASGIRKWMNFLQDATAVTWLMDGLFSVAPSCHTGIAER